MTPVLVGVVRNIRSAVFDIVANLIEGVVIGLRRMDVKTLVKMLGMLILVKPICAEKTHK